MREFFSAESRDTRRAQKRDDSTDESDLDQEPIDGLDGSTDEDPMPELNDDPV